MQPFDQNDKEKRGMVSDLTPMQPSNLTTDETVVSNHARSASTPSPGRDLSGTSFGVYRLDRKIAEGGMGEVYEATQLNLDRKVAIKLLTDRLSTRPEFLHRFEREAKSAAALNHPNVVQVYDFGYDKGQHYLAMEFVEGEDMSEHLQRVGKLDLVSALTVIEQAASALKAAREKSIIHRDIKPANLMRTRDGTIKVSDLGLAKKLTDDSEVTATGVGIGSPHFLAPEQADDARTVDHRADIYSLGITLLFMLTGKRPYDGTSAFSVVMAHASKPLPSGDELGTTLPDNVEALINRMSAKRPEDRYQDYDVLLADLARVKAGYSPAIAPLRSGSIWSSTGAKIALAGACVALTVLVTVMVLPKADPVKQASAAPAKTSESPQTSTKVPVGSGSSEVDRGGFPTPPPPPSGAGGRPPGVNPSASGRFTFPLRSAPLRVPIQLGPIKTMLADADVYAKNHPTNYVEIILAYQQCMNTAGNTPFFSEAKRKLDNSVALHQFHAFHEIDERTPVMRKFLKERKLEEAWDVWKNFPENLRVPEIEDEIYKIVEQEFPPRWTPKR